MTGLVLAILALPVALGRAGETAEAANGKAGGRDPARSLPAEPDYFQSCAISGLDDSPGCLQVALAAVDRGRAKEGIAPLRLPPNYAQLPFDQQMLLVVDGERVARHLQPIVGLVAGLDQLAGQGAAADTLAPRPGGNYGHLKLDAAAGFANALDLDYEWLYDDGPGSGTSGCTHRRHAGCWADRNRVLAHFPRGGELVMGAADDPVGDTEPGDKGGATMALVMARAVDDPAVTVSWASETLRPKAPALAPLHAPPLGMSPTGIADPQNTEPPRPDYLAACAASGSDDSSTCTAAVLSAIDNARIAEGVRPMVLPPSFPEMSTAEQLFVLVNLERVDRNLPPFTGMTAAMDTNAAKGADSGTDPPDPAGVLGDDEEWEGGAIDALAADYQWMYDDGKGSGNPDCPSTGGPGCWDHRNGILDAYGTVGTLVIGAAYDPTGDRNTPGLAPGSSIALTLAVQLHPPKSWLVTWAQIVAGTSAS